MNCMNYNETVKNKIKGYARARNTTLVFGHGVQDTDEKFVVREKQAIVFIAPIGSVLSQRALTKRFYEIFSNSKSIEDYVSGTLRKIPVFMREWSSRTYGPGTTCPDLWLDFTDAKWKSMGIVPLPLRGVLKPYSQSTMATLKPLFRSTTAPVVLTNSNRHGTRSRLSAVVRDLRGVVFVIACRKITESINANALTAHEKAQKLLKRKRKSSENASSVKKQKTRDERLEKEKKRRELLERLDALKTRIQARKTSAETSNRLGRLENLKSKIKSS